MMATQLAEPTTRRWTRTEYYQMAELGLFHGQRVQLIEGEIVQMPPQKNLHFAAITLAQDALRSTFGQGYWVRTLGPLALGPASEPEPDIAVVTGSPRAYAGHPSTALLVVEVSDTTLRYDRHYKASLYARAGIADYWIINLVDRQVEVFRKPGPDSKQPLGFDYSDVMSLGEGETVSSLAMPHGGIAVKDILP